MKWGSARIVTREEVSAGSREEADVCGGAAVGSGGEEGPRVEDSEDEEEGGEGEERLEELVEKEGWMDRRMDGGEARRRSQRAWR